MYAPPKTSFYHFACTFLSSSTGDSLCVQCLDEKKVFFLKYISKVINIDTPSILSYIIREISL